MRRAVLVVFATMAAIAISGGPAVAGDFRKMPAASAARKLHLSPAEIAARSGSNVYIVQLAEKPASAYQGGIAGFSKSAPAKGQRYNAHSGEAQAYAARLVQKQDALLRTVGASDKKIYSYVHAMNGFAAKLTRSQAAKLQKSKGVLKVWQDRRIPVDTNNTPSYLGLTNADHGLRNALGLTGEGVIIGVIDSGAVQEHPSLAGTGFGAPPAQWAGTCEAGEGWDANDCNNKLIGARFYNEGFLAGDTIVDGDFLSPRDSDGHGTHTATTAGGNKVRGTLNGTRLTWVSGMAPRARIAVYKACWQAPDAPQAGCDFSDTVAATDDAVADGVDVINFSIGTAQGFDDPQDIAFLFAVDAGVVVARSSGNEGPAPGTTAAGEPWNITVAAATHRGNAFATATRINAPAPVAGDYPSYEGAITQPLVDSGPFTGDVAVADPADACAAIAPLDGIALIARGTCDFSVKITNAVNAGADAVIVYTQAGNPRVVMGGTATPESLSVPGVMVDNEVGVALADQIANAQTVNATLSAGVFVTERLTGNIMADFSSRGPYTTEANWLKPDVAGPGVQVLAGSTPEPNSGATGDFFKYLSGTSMATPHVAGIAALLLEAHPAWTPGIVKSALMTTAGRRMVKEDGVTKADPFDLGSGMIIPNRAVDPGLAYDNGFLDFLAASCGSDTPLVSPDDCTELTGIGFSTDPSDLNLASIAVDGLIGSKTVTRTVTNVSGASETYTADVSSPLGFRTKVNPTSFTIGAGETATYTVTISNKNASPGQWSFGSLTWRSGTHNVRSPIAVNAQTVDAPAVVTGTPGADGTAAVEVTFGFNGTYTPGAHGMVEPFLTQFAVEDDPADSFDFSLEADEPLVYLFDAPEGAAALEFATYDAYNEVSGNDLDLYVFYCPDFECTQVGASLTATADELVRIPQPLSDPNIDDPYAVFVHGFSTVGGATANAVFFDWTVEGAVGNLTVDPETINARIGQTGTVNAAWTGLTSGPTEKWVGAVSHSSANGIEGLTMIEVDNDPDGGYCDVVECAP